MRDAEGIIAPAGLRLMCTQSIEVSMRESHSALVDVYQV